jgi:hypothetical protein
MIDGRNGVSFEQFGDIGVKLAVRSPRSPDNVNRLMMRVVGFISRVEGI